MNMLGVVHLFVGEDEIFSSSEVHPRGISVCCETGNTAEKSYHLPSNHTDEMEDNTGDSGMGTGSETGPYSTVEIWKQAMKNPPPGMQLVHSAKMRSSCTSALYNTFECKHAQI